MYQVFTFHACSYRLLFGQVSGLVLQQLFYIQQQTLEVLAFRVVDVHGMVRRLVEAVKDADAAAGFRSGGKDGKRKGFLVHHLGAAEGEHEAAWSHLGDGGGIESLVCPEGILQSSPMLGECGRVHYDKVVLSFRYST